MQKKTTGVIAGIAGAALLMGGTTFALWSDSDTVDGAEITAGNLDVAVLGDPGSQWSWQDISADRTDNSHEIDLADFRIIPGDTIEGTVALDVALEGENMVAALGANLGAASGDLTNLDIDVAVTDSNGDPVTLNSGGTLVLASQDNGNPDPQTLTTVGATLDDTADVTVTVTVTFPASTGGQDHVTDSIALDGATVTLDQVRSDADGYIG
ncbi:MAG TPA: alternate-type signal peptide domain-containing protein [Candidatus Ruania gallistercoris]|uniref:Alternate-type signal peptide domain-containing protein n=1 Tax=Candidatus Ruania gallistercoris TaxID=2838746 RepID=A0A9D2EFU2_9MICO|nr:alternate-type signal peptide domain-containing protein [Candidatus Ruania gallistercoris]